ncbi:YihY/virulence factor BrkB family protein [Actinospica robiniae]|uniref:YihY/virulence factor BrkB family protein n=1 Tax=Actinospica robiniae TaxID=304901 RepID=UPI0004246BEB|nr:YihY/virulence factor BrkB family protein [Actinospica robiniae]
MKRFITSVDAFQQRHRALAFPIAVWHKFSDDQAGSLAALLAYYAFLSTFPLLLVLVTVLGMVLSGNPQLQKDVLNSALTEFPVIGDQLRANVHSLGRSGFGLAVGLVLTFVGARGVANAMQNAMNTVWGIPRHERPSFPGSWLRSFALIAIIGLGVVVTSGLSGIASWSGHTEFGGGLRFLIVAVSLVLNILLFWLGLRTATSGNVTWRDLILGAILSAIVWQVLQYVGGYVVAHSLRHASELYGTFGLVLGLLSWFALQAQLTLYAVEADVVRSRRLWPRSLFPPPLTEQDREVLRSYAEAEQRRPEIRVETHFEPEQDTEPHEQAEEPHEQDVEPHEQDVEPHEQDVEPHEQDHGEGRRDE